MTNSQSDKAPLEVIALNVSTSTSTVFRTKQRFVEEGLAAALSEEPRPGAERKLSVGEEALLVATACSKPFGRPASRWVAVGLQARLLCMAPLRQAAP